MEEISKTYFQASLCLMLKKANMRKKFRAYCEGFFGIHSKLKQGCFHERIEKNISTPLLYSVNDYLSY